MAPFNDLSAELLLIVASYLSQVDLLNISVTCKRLRSATECELYREYYNPHLHRRSVKSYVLRLLSREDLARNVRSVIVDAGVRTNGWQCFMDALDDDFFPGTSPLTRFEYNELSQAAINFGIITHALPWHAVSDIVATAREASHHPVIAQSLSNYVDQYESAFADEAETQITNKNKVMDTSGDGIPNQDAEALQEEYPESEEDENPEWYGYQVAEDHGPLTEALSWYQYIHRTQLQDLSYDNRFCAMLGLGFKDSWLALLLHLVPNIRHIDFLKTPGHHYTLPWKFLPGRVPELRSFTAFGEAGLHPWPLAFFESFLRGARLEKLELYLAGGGWQYLRDRHSWLPMPLTFAPQSTNITQLVLQRCTFSKTDMQVLVEACTTLKSLNFSTRGHDYDPQNFTAPELVELLQPHKNCLEELVLDLCSPGQADWGTDYLPSLSEFIALKKLNTDVQAWSDILLSDLHNVDITATLPSNVVRLKDVLPPALQHLILRAGNYAELGLREIVHLVRTRSETHPDFQKLTVLHLEAQWHFKDPWYHKLARQLSQSNPWCQDFDLEFSHPLAYEKSNPTAFTLRAKPPVEWRSRYMNREQYEQCIQSVTWQTDTYVSEAKLPIAMGKQFRTQRKQIHAARHKLGGAKN